MNTKDWRENLPVYAEWKSDQFPRRVLELENGDRINKDNYYVLEYKFHWNIGSFRATGEYPKAFCKSPSEIRKFIEASTGKPAPKNFEDLREMVGAEGFTMTAYEGKRAKIKRLVI